MTLEEGIIHAEDVARMNHEAAKHLTDEHPTQAEKCEKCASEHRQLAEWLKELKAYKEQSGDAISRQAVLDAMYELCDTGETLKENPWRDNPHIDAITDAIENLPSVTPQRRTGRWIPVWERVPEEKGTYLVTQEATFTDYVYISVIGYALNLHDVDEYDFADKKRPGWYEYDSEWGYRELDDVIAWMPLVEPYGEVK